jgi:hypothetical protein
VNYSQVRGYWDLSIITFRHLRFPLEIKSVLNASRKIYFDYGHALSKKRLKNLCGKRKCLNVIIEKDHKEKILVA